MFRTAIAATLFALAVGQAGAQTLPPQPPPVSGSFGGATDPEREACHPDVVKYCRPLLRDDGNEDIFAILHCLQDNRPRITIACQTVLASHGQ